MHLTMARFGLLSLLGASAALTAFAPERTQNPSSRPVRVLLASVPREVPLSQTGPWKLVDASRRVVARAETTDRWSVLRDGRRLRVIFADAPTSPWTHGPLSLEMGNDEVTWQGKTYRGTLNFVATDSALIIVNRIDV